MPLKASTHIIYSHPFLSVHMHTHVHVFTYTYSHTRTFTRSRAHYTFTQHYSLSPSLITRINLRTSCTVTHGTPVGQCIARRSHMPWSSSSLFDRNSISLFFDRLSRPERLTQTSHSINKSFDTNILFCRHTNFGMGPKLRCVYVYVLIPLF